MSYQTKTEREKTHPLFRQIYIYLQEKKAPAFNLLEEVNVIIAGLTKAVPGLHVKATL